MAIILKSEKNLPLSHAELDGNFIDIDSRLVNLETTTPPSYQSLSLNGSALSISGGNSVTLPASVTTQISVLQDSADGNGSLVYSSATGVFTFKPADVQGEVDLHLNTSTATTGQVLSWNGADYEWTSASAASGDLTGSVFANDSTLLVDGVNGKIVGNVDTSVVETGIVTSQGGNLTATGATLIVGAANGTAQGGNTLISGGVGTAGNGGTANISGGPGSNGNGGTAYLSGGVSTNGNGGDVSISSGRGDINGGTVYITSANGGSGSAGGIELATQNGYISLNGPTISIGTSEDDSGIYIGQHNINNTTITNIYGDVIHRQMGIEFRGSDITFTEYQPDNKSPTVDFTNADVTGAGFTFNQPLGPSQSQFGFDADIIDFGDGKTIDMQNSTVLFSGSTVRTPGITSVDAQSEITLPDDGGAGIRIENQSTTSDPITVAGSGDVTVSSLNGEVIIETDVNGTHSVFINTGKLTLQQDQIRVITYPPGSSKGAAGDQSGMFAFGSGYIYYCTTSYTDGVADIWKRVAWSGDTW